MIRSAGLRAAHRSASACDGTGPVCTRRGRDATHAANPSPWTASAFDHTATADETAGCGPSSRSAARCAASCASVPSTFSRSARPAPDEAGATSARSSHSPSGDPTPCSARYAALNRPANAVTSSAWWGRRRGPSRALQGVGAGLSVDDARRLAWGRRSPRVGSRTRRASTANPASSASSPRSRASAATRRSARRARTRGHRACSSAPAWKPSSRWPPGRGTPEAPRRPAAGPAAACG